MPGHIAQSVASLIADPGFAHPHTFVEIDHEIFSTVILLPLIQEGLLSVTCTCKLNYVHLKLVNRLVKACLREKSVVRLTDHLDMTIAVDKDVKPQTKQTP